MGNNMKSRVQRQMAYVYSNDHAQQEPRRSQPDAELRSVTLDVFPVGPIFILFIFSIIEDGRGQLPYLKVTTL